MILKITMLVAFFAMMLGVGLYTRTKAKDINGFVLGGRSIGPWLTAFAYGTSYFSAVVFIGYAGQFGWKYGISSTWIGLGNAFLGSLLAWIVMGRRTRIMTHHLDAKTMPDFFGKRFQSEPLRIAAAAITFVFLIPYTASLYKGLSVLFGLAFDIPYIACVIAMALLTSVYVSLGGYMATAITDFIQGFIMIGGIVAVIAAVITGQGGFLCALKELSTVPADPSVAAPALKEMSGMFTSFFGPDPLNLLGVVILTSLGTWGLPQMVGKFYAINSEKAIKTGTVVSTVFAVIIAGGCYFLGGFARLFDSPQIHGPKGIVYDSIIPQMLSTLPDILIGIVVVLVLSASMSTLSSLVLTSSSTLTLDMLKITCLKNLNEKRTVFVMRVFIMFFIFLSVVMALNPPDFIAQLMGYSWGALAGSFLASFLFGLFSKKVTRAAVWANFIWGVGLTLVNMFPDIRFIQSPINCGAIAMVGGLVIVPLVSLVTPKLKTRDVEQMFDCYNEKVNVPRKLALADENEQ